ncbi:MAG TPA: ABC transporter permease [Phycisphaerae bacterium]|nr:ABC transporter permease [Phycisphaerae bacterium]
MDATFIFHEALLSATPLLLAGTGELVAERAGVIDIGIEGLMIVGAIAAYGAAVLTGSVAWAVPAAAAAGVALAGLFALVTVYARADQIVAGAALNLLAFGMSTTAWRMLQGALPTHAPPAMYEQVSVPVLSRMPFIGAVLFQQYGLFYAAVILAGVVDVLLRFTRLGLVVTALGDAPEAADAMGIRVRGGRLLAVLFAGACAGAAGAYLSTMRNHSFQLNMTAGQGFLVLALVIFARWSLPGLAAAAVLFGALDALQSALASLPGATVAIPHGLFDMLPYAATLVALTLLSRAGAGPLELGKPWPAPR